MATLTRTHDSTPVTQLAASGLSADIAQSEIRVMSVECDRVHGINLAQGICDTEPPAPVVEAAIAAIRNGHNTYTRLDGIAKLRAAIAKKMARYNGVPCDPDTGVLVTSGATGGLHAACLALLNPGDEVVLFEPLYGYHRNTLQSQRVVPVTVLLDAPRWEVDVDRLRHAITPRTRAILLNTPCNPSGKVYTRKELEGIAAVAEQYNLFVMTDEMYEYFLCGDAEHISFASLPGMAERTITMSGFSKTFSVTGWRLGYLTADPKWIPSIGYFHDLLYVCAPSPLQHGAAAGLLELPDDFYRGLATEHQQKRDQLVEALNAAGLTPFIPDGAYYILADATRIPGATAKEKARYLLANCGVAAVAGTAFFTEGRGENLLRFCYAKKPKDLAEACQRLQSLRL
ncbi:MAG: pyridoxal phosphate-dependent aminotransferase [Acidobacteriaceae bacterium]